ncbi:MAG TPA: nucleotidyltransferase domain-containing protein [Candidatus Omnitrophota bacterium]|nr:nucleotidyltransferase domain-containing protein [Candidatus Omnitrophota bacterium]
MKQSFVAWTPEQSRYYVETLQQFEAWGDADSRVRTLAGAMAWKTAKGRQYLVRIRDRGQSSLGPRSPETEAMLHAFQADKTEAVKRLRAAESRLAELAGFNIAARLNRVPKRAAGLLTMLARRGLLGRTIHVVGTHALYAYEAMAAAFLTPDLMETSDLDFLVDPRRRASLRLAVAGVPPQRIIDVLREIDPSFEPVPKRKFSARNRDDFVVDLIKAAPKDPIRPSAPVAAGDIEPAEIVDLKWLVNAPKVQVMAVGEDGFPVPMSVPDPRAYALYKFHISQDPRREPVKKIRDAAQAEALVALVDARLPTYPFDPDQLRMFPRPLRQGVAVNPLWSTAPDAS